MKPICVKCGLFYKPKKNGTYFTESMPRGGTWVPYRVWCGDMWECPGCKSLVIVGCGAEACTEHYRPDFELERRRLGADKININGC